MFSSWTDSRKTPPDHGQSTRFDNISGRAHALIPCRVRISAISRCTSRLVPSPTIGITSSNSRPMVLSVMIARPLAIYPSPVVVRVIWDGDGPQKPGCQADLHDNQDCRPSGFQRQKIFLVAASGPEPAQKLRIVKDLLPSICGFARRRSSMLPRWRTATFGSLSPDGRA